MALASVIAILVCAPVAHAQSLDQLVQQLEEKPGDTALHEQIIKLAKEENLAIPEEARAHFVEGAAIAQSAKDAEGQKLAVASFKEAVKIAPWWGEAYYNLAVAQELAGQLDDAQSSLKFYILTNPGEKESREAQDKIYALKGKKKIVEADAAANAERAAQKQAQQEAEAQREKDALWNADWSVTSYNSDYGSSGQPYDIRSAKNGNIIEFFDPGLAEQTRVILRGTVSDYGISWEVNRWPCGMFPVNVSVSGDNNSVQFSTNTIDTSNCQYFSDVNTFTYMRK